jgi:hypothetical protein
LIIAAILSNDFQNATKLEDNFKPDFSKLRRILFWDTDFDLIDWERKRVAIIQRLSERGNEIERAEIARFYGLEKIDPIAINIGRK